MKRINVWQKEIMTPSQETAQTGKSDVIFQRALRSAEALQEKLTEAQEQLADVDLQN